MANNEGGMLGGDDDDAGIDGISPLSIGDAQAVAKAEREAAEKAVVEVVERLQRAYRRLFAGINDASTDAGAVFADLKPFCRGDASTFAPDERTHCLLTGRQEVYLRIKDYLETPLEVLATRRLALIAQTQRD